MNDFDMRHIIAKCLILFITVIPIAVSDISNYEVYDDANLEAGLTLEDSTNLYAGDDLLPDMPTSNQAEDYEIQLFPVNVANDCSPELENIPPLGKARRGDSCQANGEYMNEVPFILPKTLLDAGTIDTEKYCTAEIFDEFSAPYLVCSSGFSMDMVDHASIYQALVNSEIGEFPLHVEASLCIVPLSSQN